MGIVPIWGFQMAVALALSFVFKLNKALVIIAANISLPPLIPFILFGSHWVGGFWLGDKALPISFDQEITLELFQNSMVQYIIGAFTLASVLGWIGGWLAYGVMKLYSHSEILEEVE